MMLAFILKLNNSTKVPASKICFKLRLNFPEACHFQQLSFWKLFICGISSLISSRGVVFYFLQMMTRCEM